MRPLIGISQCLDERGRWHATREYAYLDTSYAGALAESGATPVLLPLQEDVSALTQRLDGLLIPGGDDFPPSVSSQSARAVPARPSPSTRPFSRRAVAPTPGARDLRRISCSRCSGEASSSTHPELPPQAGPHRLADLAAPRLSSSGSKLAACRRSAGSREHHHHQPRRVAGLAPARARTTTDRSDRERGRGVLHRGALATGADAAPPRAARRGIREPPYARRGGS